MPDWLIPCLAACAVSTLGTLGLERFLRHRAILDKPNERSLHEVPTPRGGGMAILAGLAAGCALLPSATSHWQESLPLIVGTVLLVMVSLADDLKPLPALPRFGVQLAAVGIGLSSLHAPVFQGLLPLPLDGALTVLGWLWFTNLFNFMDGMDGMAGGEALAIAFGLFLLTGAPAALILAFAAAGFVVWNWSPARIFMGDVGSIPIGYFVGGCLLHLACDGHWAAALILPLYFLADATITLGKRLSRREKVWQAHRTHFYQSAVQAGRSHRQVATAVAATNMALIACAVWLVPVSAPAALLLAVCLVAALLGWMSRRMS